MPSYDQIALTRAQVREVDRKAIEEYEVPGVVLMENAGRNATQLISGWLPKGGSVAIVCGRGNNGGDGFVIARHLHNAGVDVALLMACDPQRLTGDAATNARIAEKMSLPFVPFQTEAEIAQARAHLGRAAIIVDGVLGTGFSGDVRSPLDQVIHAINAAKADRVVAIDVPSGLDCDTGRPSNATVVAHETITFVARKAGFQAEGASAYTGNVHVADIGAPREAVQAVLSAAASG
jgi:NAD(P)H-hydrate epimerase